MTEPTAKQIRIMVPALGGEPPVLHIFNEDAQSVLPHSLNLCRCGPTIEALNESDGYIVIHRPLSDTNAG